MFLILCGSYVGFMEREALGQLPQNCLAPARQPKLSF